MYLFILLSARNIFAIRYFFYLPYRLRIANWKPMGISKNLTWTSLRGAGQAEPNWQREWLFVS